MACPIAQCPPLARKQAPLPAPQEEGGTNDVKAKGTEVRVRHNREGKRDGLHGRHNLSPTFASGASRPVRTE